MKRKHSELIKAWADGAEIQFFRESTSEWVDTSCPIWIDDYEYRIKPEPKPDTYAYMVAAHQYGVCAVSELTANKSAGDNIKLTFDGETGKLKAAEVIGD